jgi:hypothetical protein
VAIGGDATLDDVVNLADFHVLAANFGLSDRTWQTGDFNPDGLTNLIDFNLLAANFGLGVAGPNVTPQDWSVLAVPEPVGTVAAAVLVGAIVTRRARRTRG